VVPKQKKANEEKTARENSGPARKGGTWILGEGTDLQESQTSGEKDIRGRGGGEIMGSEQAPSPLLGYKNLGNSCLDVITPLNNKKKGGVKKGNQRSQNVTGGWGDDGQENYRQLQAKSTMSGRE